MKNKTLILLSALTTLIIPLTVKAGTEMHGGDSVVCFQDMAQKQKVETTLRQNKLSSQMGHIRQDPFADVDMSNVTVETLEIWEARQSMNPSPVFIEVSNVDEAVKNRMDLLEAKIELLGNKLKESYNSFYNPSKWLASSTGIVEIDDSHELINYTKYCIPVQIAVQTNTRVYYDGRLFSKLDNVNKTALILHELMYSWVKTFSDSSFNVRKYVGLLMQKNFEQDSDEEFLNEIKVDFAHKVNRNDDFTFAVWIQCQTTILLENVTFTVNFKSAGLNKKACSSRLGRIDAYRLSAEADPAELKVLSKKLGIKISSAQAGLINGKIAITTLFLDDEFYNVPTITPFQVDTNYASLSVQDGVIDLLPNATRIKLLGQEIDVDDLTYTQTASGEYYLSGFKLNKDMKLKSASGLLGKKKFSKGYNLDVDSLGRVIGYKHY